MKCLAARFTPFLFASSLLVPCLLGGSAHGQAGCATETFVGPNLPGSRFGWRLLLEDDLLFASEPYQTNRVNIYRDVQDTWTPHGVLQGPSVGGGTRPDFGASLAFSAPNLIVGSPRAQLVPGSVGAVLIYDVPPAPTLPTLLSIIDGPTGNDTEFGVAVAIDDSQAGGPLVCIGAPLFLVPNTPVAQYGAVRVYRLEPTGPVFVQDAIPTGSSGHHRFGGSIDAEGGLLVAGPLVAPWSHDKSLFAFAWNGFEYAVTQEIDMGPDVRRVGVDVTLDGDRLWFGLNEEATFDRPAGSAVALFERDVQGQYQSVERLRPSFPSTVSLWRLAAKGETVVIRGAYNEQAWTSVFRETPSGWVELHVTSTSSMRGVVHGGDVAFDDDRILSAAKPESGLPYPIEITESRQFGDAYELGPGVAGTVTPILSAGGCFATSTPATVRVDGAPGAVGALIVSRVAVQSPLFGGTLYVGSPLVVAEAHALDASGTFELTLPLTSISGRSYRLQAGYLDASAPSGVALSNGLEVVVR